MGLSFVRTLLATLLFATVVVNCYVLLPPQHTPLGHVAHAQVPEFDANWYRKTIFYQVYPASFQDGNGDGTGDLVGITHRLDHFLDIGVGTVWLSPVFESPMLDNGYDISNFTNINPLFGTLEDFDKLMLEAKQRGLRLIMDMVPNHSSNEHAWFNASRHRIEPYSDYYVWHAGNPDAASVVDGRMRNGVPNNWLSIFDGPAWQWDDVRQEYYYHAFLVQQPDLNYRSEALRDAVKNVLKFWLDRGVDGFRLDAYKYAFEAADALDKNETHNPNSGVVDPKFYGYFFHNHTEDLPETFENLLDWRNFVTDYAKNNNRDHIFLVTECYEGDVSVAMQYDTYKDQKAADFTFNFNLVNVTNTTTGYDIAHAVQVWLDYLPADSWPNWVIGNHDNWRIADRIGYNLIDVMNALNLLLPGTPFTYYGEEIGMVNNFNITIDQVKDKAALTPEHLPAWWKFTRDYERTPMQWQNVVPNANFTTPTATPYLPVNAANLATINVESENSTKKSHQSVYKQFSDMRRQPAFSDNKNLKITFVDATTFTFVRTSNGALKYTIALDLRRDRNLPTRYIDLTTPETNTKGSFGTVAVAAGYSYCDLGLKAGVQVPLNAVPLVPGGVLIFRD